MTDSPFYPPRPGTMTPDEHLAEAESCLYRAMSRGTGEKAEHAIAEATIGLLHLALAAAKPVVTVTPSRDLAEVVLAAIQEMEASRERP